MEKKRINVIDHNIFALLCDDPHHIVDATEDIQRILKKTSNKIRKLSKKYPDAGIGDTATDECITDHFYEILH